MITMEKQIDRLQAALAQAQSLGAPSAKIGLSCGEKTTVNFEAGRLKNTGGAQTFSFTVDTLVNGRRGQATGGHLDDLPRTVEQAVGLAQLGSVAHFDAWPAPGEVTPVPAYAESTVALSREMLIDACRTMTEMLKAYDPDLFIGCMAQRSIGESLLVTSGGVAHTQRTTYWALNAYVQRTNGTDMLFASDMRYWGEMNALFDPRAITEQVLFQLRQSEQPAPASTGQVTVFLTPEALMSFLWPLSMGINGRSVAKGESPLATKLGQRIISPAFTVVDNPHLPYSGRTTEVDTDGIPTRRQTLIENGVLQRFLYDLDSAGLAGVEPTGNSGCAPYNPVVSPGRRSSAELLASIADGLYVTDNLVGFGQSNIINGDFSCNVGLGYRIKDGQLIGRVKDTMIAGNLYEILNGNVELSADTSYDGTYPFAVVEGVSASAKG